jgi:uncharacterized protein YndB with AHSA1/START domain
VLGEIINLISFIKHLNFYVMPATDKTVITVTAKIYVPVEKVWNLWTDPNHITNWNNASEDWHTTRAENDLRTGGKFLSRMEAKDGSMGFDFIGVYSLVDPLKKIAYTMEDGRKAEITFSENGGVTDISESFEAEDMNAIELQEAGWQSILNNFKKYAED